MTTNPVIKPELLDQLLANYTKPEDLTGEVCPRYSKRSRDRCRHPLGHAHGDGHEATQDRPKARSGCPFNKFFSNWASGARLGASAAVHILGFHIFTQVRRETGKE